jgi:Ca2+-transporting ATPase
MILILIVVAIASRFLGGITDTVIILIILSTPLSFCTRIELKKMEALKDVIPDETRYSGGKTIAIATDD